MFRLPLRATRWILLSLCSSVFFSGCLVTNELGLQPPGAVAGEVLKNRVLETAAFAFALSLKGYCNRFASGSSTCDNETGAGEREGQFLLQILLPDASGIQPGDFYTAASAAECCSQIRLNALVLPGLYLHNQETRTGTGSINIDDAPGKVTAAAVFTALLAGDACRGVLAEPGPLLYSGFSSTSF